MVALVQMPCRSGWPSGVRGAVHLCDGAVAADGGACANMAGAAASARAEIAASAAAHAVPSDHVSLARIEALRSGRSVSAVFARHAAEMPVEELLGELHALIFHQLRVLFRVAIE